MASFDGKFESTKQDWTTPLWMFNVLNTRYSFNFDIAASSDNALCDLYFTEFDNALSKAWSGRCWLNPPYGGRRENKLANWVKKAYKEGQNGYTTVTMLLPARTNTSWWHKYCMKAKEIIFLQGRPKFGDDKHGLPQPLAIIHFDESKMTKLLSLNVSKKIIGEMNVGWSR